VILKSIKESIIKNKTMKEITTKNFIDAWKEFVTKNEKKLILNFTEKITRTEAIIGRSRRSLTKSPFGNFITEYFNNEIEYRTEESSIDLVIAGKNKFQLSERLFKNLISKFIKHQPDHRKLNERNT